MWVISFTSQRLNPRGKRSSYLPKAERMPEPVWMFV